MNKIFQQSQALDVDEHVTRLTAALAQLVPTAEILPSCASGHDVQVPIVVCAEAAWAVENLRVHMEKAAVLALGAAMLRVWPPAKVGDETWYVSVRRDRVGLLADALATRTRYPLVLVPQSAWELARVAPAVAEGEPEIGVHDVAEHRHRPPASHYLRLLSAEQLDDIDEALREDKARDERGPFPGLWAQSSLGGGTAVLREAVKQARSHPVEVSA